MNLLVAGRITGSVLIICAYFVILHVSTFYGAIMHIIADIICIPFYVQNKQWDVAIMLAFLMSISISKVAILLAGYGVYKGFFANKNLTDPWDDHDD